MLKRAAGALAVLCVLATSADAHDIPTDVVIQAFVKPEGRQLSFLVRVPLPAMQDMTVPTREQGYLDLTRVDTVLRDAAAIWIVDSVKIYEGERPLPTPEIVAARCGTRGRPRRARSTSARACAFGSVIGTSLRFWLKTAPVGKASEGGDGDKL